MAALTVTVRGRNYWRSAREVERRQAKCDHVWHHEFATVSNRLVSSTWCRKCKMTAFAYEKSKRS